MYLVLHNFFENFKFLLKMSGSLIDRLIAADRYTITEKDEGGEIEQN